VDAHRMSRELIIYGQVSDEVSNFKYSGAFINAKERNE
jgi:hypothetical protein